MSKFTSFAAASIVTVTAKPTIDDAAAACLGLEFLSDSGAAIAVADMVFTIASRRR
jgi:hypothetical protein